MVNLIYGFVLGLVIGIPLGIFFGRILVKKGQNALKK